MPTLRYLGHSAFVLEADGRQVLIDPFITGNPSATMSADDFHPTAILLTHAHNDHVGDAPELGKRTGCPVITINELGVYLGSQGVPGAIGANHGGTVAFDGGTVKFVPAWHSSSFAVGDGVVAPGVPAGLVVRFGGKTIYFAGDTCLFGDMALIGEEGIDIAVLPIGGHFTMGPEDATRAVKLIKPKVVIPCHYNTFPPISQDPEIFKQMVEEQTPATCVVLAPGETYDAG